MEKISYEKGTSADRRTIVAFANEIFGKDYGGTDFTALLPKLYGEEADCSRYHYLAKSGGNIVGMLGAFPLEVNIMGRRLPACGIGTVCTRPDFRGRGVMTELFRSAIADMQSGGAAFSVLGGQRQRYEHFGYEPCGTMVEFVVTSANLQPFLSGARELFLAPLEHEDGAAIGMAHEIQQRRPVSVRRSPELFHATCRSWSSMPLLLCKNGEFCGYFVCSADRKNVWEFELTNKTRLPVALAAYLDWSGEREIHFSLPPYEREKIAELEVFCEYFNVCFAHSFLIFDWEGVLQQLFELKATYFPLADGRFVLEIQACGKFAFQVFSQKATVEKTQASADVSLDRLSAMRMLFSPLSAFYSYAPHLGAFSTSWFPLPLCLPRIDEV